jgi:hypothetical protein
MMMNVFEYDQMICMSMNENEKRKRRKRRKNWPLTVFVRGRTG